MKYFSKETITSLQKEFKQIKHVQFKGIKDNPTLFKQELQILQSYNILELAPSDIKLVQWDTKVAPVSGTTKIINIGDIIARATTIEDYESIVKKTPTIFVFLPEILSFGIYNKNTNKIVLDNNIIINDPFNVQFSKNIEYIKIAKFRQLAPTLIATYTKDKKYVTDSRKTRGFTAAPVKGDKFRIRPYYSMKTEFNEKISTIQVENEDTEMIETEARYILPATELYGLPFVKICESLCGITGTITNYNKDTGVINAIYEINNEKISSITTIQSGESTFELSTPIVIHEQHIEKI